MNTLLKNHFEVVEKLLLARYDVSKNAGHSVNKGTAREFFLKEFLIEHLSELVGIGQGEIIDANTQAAEPRNQQDVILYRRDFPKIRFGGDITGFLAESAIATVEVKSKLAKEDIVQAVKAAYKTKNLERSFSSTYFNPNVLNPRPKILSFVVAYDSSVRIPTIQSWLKSIHEHNNIPYLEIGANVPASLRPHFNTPSIDGIFLLGKGFVIPATGLLTFNIDGDFPDGKWLFAENQSTNLLILFLILTLAIHYHNLAYVFEADAYMRDLGEFSIRVGS